MAKMVPKIVKRAGTLYRQLRVQVSFVGFKKIFIFRVAGIILEGKDAKLAMVVIIGI